jgi:hypothetical protein
MPSAARRRRPARVRRRREAREGRPDRRVPPGPTTASPLLGATTPPRRAPRARSASSARSCRGSTPTTATATHVSGSSVVGSGPSVRSRSRMSWAHSAFAAPSRPPSAPRCPESATRPSPHGTARCPRPASSPCAARRAPACRGAPEGRCGRTTPQPAPQDHVLAGGDGFRDVVLQEPEALYDLDHGHGRRASSSCARTAIRRACSRVSASTDGHATRRDRHGSRVERRVRETGHALTALNATMVLARIREDSHGAEVPPGVREPDRAGRSYAAAATREPVPRRDGARQAGVLQPGGERQGPYGTVDRPGRRGRRTPQAGWHDPRGDERQHRHRAGVDRRLARLQGHHLHARRRLPRAPRAAACARRRARPHPRPGRHGRRQPGGRTDPRAHARRVPVGAGRQPRQPVRALHDHRSGDLGGHRGPGRRAGLDGGYRAARSPAPARTCGPRTRTSRSTRSSPARRPC